MAFDATSLSLSAMADSESIYAKFETGFASDPETMEDVLIKII